MSALIGALLGLTALGLILLLIRGWEYSRLSPVEKTKLVLPSLLTGGCAVAAAIITVLGRTDSGNVVRGNTAIGAVNIIRPPEPLTFPSPQPELTPGAPTRTAEPSKVEYGQPLKRITSVRPRLALTVTLNGSRGSIMLQRSVEAQVWRFLISVINSASFARSNDQLALDISILDRAATYGSETVASAEVDWRLTEGDRGVVLRAGGTEAQWARGPDTTDARDAAVAQALMKVQASLK